MDIHKYKAVKEEMIIICPPICFPHGCTVFTSTYIFHCSPLFSVQWVKEVFKLAEHLWVSLHICYVCSVHYLLHFSPLHTDSFAHTSLWILYNNGGLMKQITHFQLFKVIVGGNRIMMLEMSNFTGYHLKWRTLTFIQLISSFLLSGKATISNDGATIISLLDVVHPAAKTLVDISKSQDAEVNDSRDLTFFCNTDHVTIYNTKGFCILCLVD